MDASPDAIVITAPNGDLLAYNDNAKELFGYGSEDSVPSNVLEYYEEPDKRGDLLSILEDSGKVSGFETVLHTRNGKNIIACVNVSVFEQSGHKVHIAIIRDISARRKAEEQLMASEKKFSSLFDSSSDAILLLDEDGRITECNKQAEKLFFSSKGRLLNTCFMDLSPRLQPGGCVSSELFFSSMADVLEGKGQRFLWQFRLKGGTLVDCNVSLTSVEVGNSKIVMCVAADLSEQQNLMMKGRLDEIRFEALSSISRMVDASLPSIYDYALEAAVSVTESEIGYIYFVNDDETELTIHAWSEGVMPQCSVNNPQYTYRVEDTGIWGDAIRLRQPVITNDYENCAGKKGLPKGHIQIKRHMNVPLFDGDSIVLLAGVGNKENDYTNEDVRQLTMLMEGMWNVVRRKQADEALREAYAGMEIEVFERTEKLSEALAGLKRKNEEISREIKSRRAAEKQLRINAGRLALATRSGKLGVWEWEIASGKLIWNERMFEIYRCRRDRFSGTYTAWMKMIHPDDLAGLEIALSDAIENNGHFEWEFRIIRPEGKTRYLKASGLTMEDPGGRPQSVIGITQDITDQRELEEQLRRYERVIAVTPDLIFLVNADYEYVMVNDSYAKAFGYSPDYFIGRHVQEFIGHDLFKECFSPRIDMAFAGRPQSHETWINLPAAGRRFFSLTYQMIDSIDKKGRLIAVAAHDITAVKLAEEDRKNIFEVSLDLLSIADFKGRFLELNPSWHKTLGWSEDDLKGRSWIDFTHPDDRERSLISMESLMEGIEVRDSESRFRDKDGNWRWISWSLHPDKERGKITAVARDVSEQKSMVEELKRLASTDPLTGASNRRFFLERAREEIDRFKRYGGSLFFMMLDIDHFKLINDTYGHEVGDRVLQELVKCSRKTLRTSDVFGRIGGEEFAAVLVQGDMDSARQVAERLRTTLGDMKIRCGKNIVKFTVSIGLTCIPSESPTIEEAMKQADRCLYQAKNEGRNRVVSRCD